MITSVIEMPELTNLGHMAKFTVNFESRDKTLLITSLTYVMISQCFKILLFQDNIVKMIYVHQFSQKDLSPITFPCFGILFLNIVFSCVLCTLSIRYVRHLLF